MRGKQRIIVLSFLLFTFLYLFPFISDLISGDLGWEQVRKPDFSAAFSRSIVFGLTSALCCILVGFFGAYLLREVSLFSKLGKYLSILLLPIVLGNTSIAFIAKLNLSNTSFLSSVIEQGYFAYFWLLVLIQCWQYGFLFLYLFWLNFNSVPNDTNNYFASLQLPKFKKFKDVLLPRSKNLILLLFLIGFVFGFQEDIKNQFIFKASQGTNSELINHWLSRNYQSNLLLNQDIAINQTYGSSIVIIIFTLMTIGLVLLLINKGIHFFTQLPIGNKTTKTVEKHFPILKIIVVIVIILIIILPLAKTYIGANISIDTQISFLFKPFFLTLIASLFAALFAITFGIFARISWQKILSEFNSKSIILFTLIYILSLLPSIILSLCGFKWMSIIGYSSETIIYLFWAVAHIILCFPLLGSFILFTHFSVKNPELEYIKAYNIPLKHTVVTSFFKRFKLEYVLTFLLAISFIWNEANLNHILSDYIPSFSSNIQMLINSKGMNYSKAIIFLSISILIAVATISIWYRIMSKAEKLNKE